MKETFVLTEFIEFSVQHNCPGQDRRGPIHLNKNVSGRLIGFYMIGKCSVPGDKYCSS